MAPFRLSSIAHVIEARTLTRRLRLSRDSQYRACAAPSWPKAKNRASKTLASLAVGVAVRSDCPRHPSGAAGLPARRRMRRPPQRGAKEGRSLREKTGAPNLHRAEFTARAADLPLARRGGQSKPLVSGAVTSGCRRGPPQWLSGNEAMETSVPGPRPRCHFPLSRLAPRSLIEDRFTIPIAAIPARQSPSTPFTASRLRQIIASAITSHGEKKLKSWQHKNIRYDKFSVNKIQ